MAEHKTLVLLDFDNVFNAMSIIMDMSPWPDGIVEKAIMPSGQHGFSYSPTVAQFFISRMDRADLCWLSTWFEETNYFGRAMGFPTLPCLSSAGMLLEPGDPWWKFQQVQRLVAINPERKILWIDDEIPEDPQDPIRLWLAEHEEQVSFIITNDLHGLMEDDLAYIADILDR